MSLESHIRAVLERDGKEGGESTVVALHCSQMREWGVRGGNIEIRPIQDDDNSQFRIKFFTKIWQHNFLQQRLDHIMDNFVCRGEILWYFQPDPENDGLYRIEFFVGGQNHPDPQFRIFYKQGGREIDKVFVRYTYDWEAPGTTLAQQRWVKLVITKDTITQSESLTKPQFDSSSNGGSFSGYNPQGFNDFSWLAGTQQYENPFKPYLPIVLSKNNARQLGQQGSDDFYWMRSLIENHEGLVTKAHKNLRMFANPILVTTRSAQEVMSQAGGWTNTWAGANRYVDNTGTSYSGSTNTADVPSWGMQRDSSRMWQVNGSEGSLDTIFGNVGEGDRFAFIQADAVSGDQNLWIRQERELIHWGLGGIDPLAGLSSVGMTFGEVKSLFGRVQNTADKKAQALYGYTGLAKVFETILWREEQIYKRGLFYALKSSYPQPFARLTNPQQLTDEICQGLVAASKQGILQLPNDLPGMMPYGDRTAIWRYTREVFVNTTREMLDLSIAARNEREDGLRQEWVLRKQYPNMTDQEIRNAMSGFSPRVVENAAQSIQIALQLFQQFMGLPDPQNPKQPWGIRLGMPQLIDQAMLTLQREIAYGRPKYEPADTPPLSLADITRQISTVQGETTNDLSLSTGNLTTSISADPVLASMGLPSIESVLAQRLYRSSDQDSQLRGSAQGARDWEATAGGDSGSPVPIFGGAVRDSVSAGDRSTTATVGATGIDPSWFPLYAGELLALLGAYQQPRG